MRKYGKIIILLTYTYLEIKYLVNSSVEANVSSKYPPEPLINDIFLHFYLLWNSR